MRMLLPHAVADLDAEAIDAAYPWPDAPWLRANMVASADGAARGPDGLSGGISSPADKRVFGALRGLADAVLVGAGTVRAEGYRPARARAAYADRRSAAGRRPAPVIAVVSRSLDLDPASPLFVDAPVRPWVITCAAADPARRSALAAVSDVHVCGDEAVDPALSVAALHEEGLTRVLTEGGPHLLAQLAAADVLDELCLTLSPVLVGSDTRTAARTGGTLAGRILAGSPLPDSPRSLRLAHVLEEDGVLFLRYLLRGAS